MARKTADKTENDLLTRKLEVVDYGWRANGGVTDSLGPWHQESINITNVLLIHNLDVQHL